MVRKTLPFLVAFAFGYSFVSAAPADLGPLEPLADFHRAVHESLGLPEPLIVRALERGLPDIELPAVGLIAVRASVPVESVIDLRLGGMSYGDLTTHYNLSSEIYNVPFDTDPGPPYGNAWGYWKKTPRAQWRTIQLKDDDIVNYSNLRLMVDRYHVTPVEVVTLHKSGKGYAAIHTEIVKTKGGPHAKAAKNETAKAASKGGGDDKAAKQKGSKGKSSKNNKKTKPPAD